MDLSFLCWSCKKQRRPVRNEHKTLKKCLRCSLNGPFLHTLFSKITKEPEMLEFTAEIKKWYLDA